MPSILSSIRQSLPAISSEPRGISGAAGSGDPFRQPIDPCPDSSASEAALPSFDNGSLAPPSQQQELASEPSNASSRFGMLAALAAGPLQPWWELERHDIMREIARPAGQATIGGAARDEVSLKNLIDDDVAHGAGRWWRERVMPYSPSDYIGEIGSYPIQGDRLRPPLFVKGGSDADEVSINDIKQQEINDYYFLGALAAVARQDPQRIKEMVEDHGDGTYTVTFKERVSDSKPPQYIDKPVTVTGDFSAGLLSTVRAAGADVTKQGSVEIWPLVFEKAFEKVFGQYRDMPGANGSLYAAGTYETFALEALTGRPATVDGLWFSPTYGVKHPKTFDQLLSDFQAGKAITVTNVVPGTGWTYMGMEFWVSYAVDKVYQDADGNQWVELYSPWNGTLPQRFSFASLTDQRFRTA